MGRCERRSEVFVKFKKKKIIFGRGSGGGRGRVGLLMLSFFLSETSTRQKLNLCGLYSSRRFHGNL